MLIILLTNTTNYGDLVGLVVSCGVENAAINVTYRSTSAVIGFIEAISVWVEE